MVATISQVELVPNAVIGKLLLLRRYVPPAMPFDIPGEEVPAQWHCKCYCGELITTEEWKIESGKVWACYHCMNLKKRKTAIKNNRIDGEAFIRGDVLPVGEVGMICGQSELLELIETEPERKWKVKCKCGEIFTTKERLIIRNNKAVNRCYKCISPR
jgi:hypothetical protein